MHKYKALFRFIRQMYICRMNLNNQKMYGTNNIKNIKLCILWIVAAVYLLPAFLVLVNTLTLSEIST